jgi:hypothetical protein
MLHTEPKVMVEKRPDVQLAVADDAQADDLIRAVGDPLSDDASSPGQSGRRKQARSPVTSVCSQGASRRHM